MRNKPLRYFESLDEVEKYIKSSLKDMTTSNSDSFKRVIRSTYRDNWLEEGYGLIQITIEHGPYYNVLKDVAPKLPWYKRIFNEIF